MSDIIRKSANDPNLAPEGYLIYTNFSFEGRTDEGKGYVRYENAKRSLRKCGTEDLLLSVSFNRLPALL